MNLTAEIKNVVMDLAPVEAAVNRATKKVLGEIGGYLRKSMMNSIKAAPYGKVSPPGSPPFDHFGAAARVRRRKAKKQGVKLAQQKGRQLGIRDIRYDVDMAREEVIVGFAGWGETPSIPQALEESGSSVNWRGRTITLKPHPTAKPALDRALSTESNRFRNLWAGSVK